LAERVRETKSSFGRDSLSLSPRSKDLELASSLFLRERERKKRLHGTMHKIPRRHLILEEKPYLSQTVPKRTIYLAGRLD